MKFTDLIKAQEYSVSHNTIATVEWQSKHGHGNREADAAMIQGHLGAAYDGVIDSVWDDPDDEGNDVLDIWGYQEDAPEGEMDWRLRVVITNSN